MRTSIWKPQFDEEGFALQNIEVQIDRADLFDDPALAEIREMLDLLEATLPAR